MRKVFEHLSLKQMLQLENPQDRAMEYALHIHRIKVDDVEERRLEKDWYNVVVPMSVKLATDPRMSSNIFSKEENFESLIR